MLHLLPLGRIDEAYDLAPHGRKLNQIVLPLRSGPDLNVRFNLDGYLIESVRSDRIEAVQWFRCGGIELVSTISVRWGPDGDGFAVDAAAFRRYAQSELPKALNFLSQELDVSGPFAVSLSLLGHNDAFIGAIPSSWDDSPYRENRFSGPWPLRVPAGLIRGPDEDVGAVLKSLFDVFWQAFGFSGSPDLPES